MQGYKPKYTKAKVDVLYPYGIGFYTYEVTNLIKEDDTSKELNLIKIFFTFDDNINKEKMKKLDLI